MARKPLMRVVAGLIWTYFLITFLAFLTSAIVAATGWWPSNWRVPWSRVGSIIETRDETIFVVVTMWGRIERYDRSGRFLGSWEQPFDKGGVSLATDEDGRIYLRHLKDVFRLGPRGELTTKYTATANLPKTWRLSQSGDPEYAPEAAGPCVRKIVSRGELLFCENGTRYYVAPDGTRLQPASHAIARVSASGQNLFMYQNPYYFRPLLFPLPGLLALVAVVVMVLIRRTGQD